MTVNSIAAPGSHAVQFYQRRDWLYRAMARFFADAWRTGSPAVMIARPETHHALLAHAGAGRDRIHFIDAETAVAGFMNGAVFDPAGASALLSDLIADLGADREFWIYGEMVDLLCQRGHHEAAIALETLWNRFVSPQVTVMCGYDLASFDVGVHRDRFRAVCEAHTHVIPAIPLAVPMVYVVDDDESMRRSLARLIGSIDVAVRTFPSAEAFLEEVEPAASGCLVLDIQLGGMSGLDLQTLMAAQGWRMPIVAMTGLHDERTEAAAMRLGAHALLCKPFHAETLFEALASTEDATTS